MGKIIRKESECEKCKGQKDCCETVEEIPISDEEMERIMSWVSRNG